MGDSASDRLATTDVGQSAEEVQAVPPMLMGESAPRRLATPEAGLSAEGDEGMPPMLKDLACRHCTTESVFNTHGGVSRGRL